MFTEFYMLTEKKTFIKCSMLGLTPSLPPPFGNLSPCCCFLVSQLGKKMAEKCVNCDDKFVNNSPL